jgi:hypothetical protein
MSESFIKKIVTVSEFQSLCKDLSELHKEDNENYGHVLDLKHDIDLMISSGSHEALLMWNIHVWGHFNGKTWDGVFVAIIRKSEKFGKKIMEEYLWLSKNSNSGLLLYNTGLEYARANHCEYIFMNLVEKNPSSNLLKKIYLKMGFTKDSESYAKKLF